MSVDQRTVLVNKYLHLLAVDTKVGAEAVAIASLVLYGLCLKAEGEGLGNAEELFRGQTALTLKNAKKYKFRKRWRQ